MHFLNPGALSYLWLLVILFFVICLNYKRRQFLQKQYCDSPMLPKMARPLTARRYLCKGIFLCLATASLIVALSRPCTDKLGAEFPRGKTDIVVMVDVSRSMAALDYKDKLPETDDKASGTRLEMAKQLVRTRLLPEAQGNQLGIVSYAGEAFPQAFLSDDLSSLKWVMSRALTISSAPGEGSAMAKALELSLKLFELDSPADNDRILVLLSDGGNDDDPEVLQKLASEYASKKIKVIVAGLGNSNPSPIPVKELAADDDVAKGLMHNGKQWYEQNGEVEKTALDENLLRIVAQSSNGKFVRISKAEDLDILTLAKAYTVSKQAGVKELFFYPLLLSLLSLIASVLVCYEFSKTQGRSL